MKQVSTRTHILLQIALALSVATYIGLRNHLLVLSGIFLGASIVFSFLAVLSRPADGAKKGKAYSAYRLFRYMHYALFTGIYLKTGREKY